MHFLTWDSEIMSYTIAITIISFIMSILMLISNIVTKRNKYLNIVYGSLVIVIAIQIASLMELCRYIRPEYKRNLSFMGEVAKSIPYAIHIAFAIMLSAIGIYMIYRSYKDSKDSLNDFSIKEALESLPTGIAFLSPSNDLYLSNNIIHKLYKALTTKDLVRGADIWKELHELKESDKCVIDSSSPAFLMEDGLVWQFTRTLCESGNVRYYEIKAINITEYYNLKKNTQQVNQELSRQHVRLKKLANAIDKSIEEEIATNLKVNFHNSFGNLLALTKETLRQGTQIEEGKVIAEYWTELSNIIADLAKGNGLEMSLEQIISFGHKINCEIVVKGELPTNHESKELILLCIDEGLKNAYRHANARRLDVEIIETKTKVKVTIYNKTKEDTTEISEGGGLAGLRKKIEQHQGSLNISTVNGVTLEVVLHKTEKGGR